MSDAWKPAAHPWQPASYDEAVVYAIRALYEGKATEGQQKLAWEWVQYVCASGDGYQDLSFRVGPDGSRRRRPAC